MTEPIISVRALSVSFGTHCVLDRVNLDVRKGEVIVLLGASGSGKSTLLRQIVGLERPSSGTVYVKGVDINRCSEEELNSLRRSMGVAFQEAALFGSLRLKKC